MTMSGDMTVQGDCDVEWKFARTRLWMMYITQGSTLPLSILILINLAIN